MVLATWPGSQVGAAPINRWVAAGILRSRLLAYRRRLLTLEESPALGDWEESELDQLEPGYVHFKDSPAWVETAAAAKALLDQRPHLDG